MGLGGTIVNERGAACKAGRYYERHSWPLHIMLELKHPSRVEILQGLVEQGLLPAVFSAPR